MRIIWTTKELEEEMKQPSISDFPPLATITAPPLSTERFDELSVVEGTVTNLIVYLPPGVRDLVWVSILLNKSFLLRAVGGDNQYHSIIVATAIKRDDIVTVILKNHDNEFSHTAGIRVEVEEK